MAEKAYLVLENGSVFPGFLAGARTADAPVMAAGELVFTTGVVGYMENLTDPAYAGQMVVQTFGEIGNAGCIRADILSGSGPAGYIVRELCDTPSNFRSDGCLEDFLAERGIPCLTGVDTRTLTRMLREEGTMQAQICRCPEDADFSARPAEVTPAAVSVSSPVLHPAVGARRGMVSLLDGGVRLDFIRAFTSRGWDVRQMPWNSTAEDLLADGTDGVVLSPGPGDPAHPQNMAQIEEIRRLLEQKPAKMPLFGVGLGHQLLALAMGGTVKKLKAGHRGSNHPVRDVRGSRTYITVQNHGYAAGNVQGAELWYASAKDGTCQGWLYPQKTACSVQFQPDGAADTAFLYDDLSRKMEEYRDAQR